MCKKKLKREKDTYGENYTRSVSQNEKQYCKIMTDQKEMIFKKDFKMNKQTTFISLIRVLISTDAHKLISFDGMKPKNIANGLNSPALQDNSFKVN